MEDVGGGSAARRSGMTCWARFSATRVVCSNGAPHDDDVLWEPASQKAVTQRMRQLATQNMTTFGAYEEAHPINFYEQVWRCYFCGRDSFVNAAALCSCKGGVLVHTDVLPTELLNFYQSADALSVDHATQEGAAACWSRVSRTANTMLRMTEMGLPKGTHSLPEAGGHLRITGQTFCFVNNVHEVSSVRSFLDDPSVWVDWRHNWSEGYRPSERMMLALRRILESCNPLVDQIRMWGLRDDVPEARLVLKWPGPTPSVRTFTYVPATSTPGPRSVFYTRLDEDEPCYVRTTNEMYPLLSWPLLFPNGARLVTRSGEPFEGGKPFSISDATMALVHQPERWPSDAGGPGEYLQMPTPCPYGSRAVVMRRVSRIQISGRLGDEFLLDRELSRQDQRRRTLRTPGVQKMILGRTATREQRQLDEEEEVRRTAEEEEAAADGGDDEASDVPRATYLPASEVGSPRHAAQSAADALYVAHRTNKPVLFVTTTCNTSWPEIASRLVLLGDRSTGDTMTQDPFDRAELSGEAFEGKRKALLARMQTGTFLGDVGRPVLDQRNCAVRVDEHGLERHVDVYKFPLATPGGGCTLQAREFQSRGLEHCHTNWAPAELPAAWRQHAIEGDAMPWVDDLTCARVPDRSVLLQFRMLITRAYAYGLAGVCGLTTANGRRVPDRAQLQEQYRWLAEPGGHDDDLVVHPDLVQDLGPVYQSPNLLLLLVIETSSGQGTTLTGCHVRVHGMRADEATWDGVVHRACPDSTTERQFADRYARARSMHFMVQPRAPDGSLLPAVVVERVRLEVRPGGKEPGHYSLQPYRGAIGLMVHRHQKGPLCAEPGLCKNKKGECGSYFPFKVVLFTQMGESGWILLRRGPADIMMVPYNPWLQVRYPAHNNVEIVGSATRSVIYLFKNIRYIFKGSDRNKGQLVDQAETVVGLDGARGGAPAVQGDSEARTHRRCECVDEVNQWFKLKETCANGAYRSFAKGGLFHMQPSPKGFSSHEPRDADGLPAGDDKISEWEAYQARPPQLELDADLSEVFLSAWSYSYEGLKPATVADAQRQSDGAATYRAAGGRTVHRGTDPTLLRLPGARTGNAPSPVTPRWYWQKSVRDFTGQCEPCEVLMRLTRVPVSKAMPYFLRELAKVRPCRSYDELLTDANGVRHDTPQAACRALGLLDEDVEGIGVLRQAIEAEGGTPPAELRSLFCQLLFAGARLDEAIDAVDVQLALGRDLGHDMQAVVGDLEKRLRALNRSVTDCLPPNHHPALVLSELQQAYAAIAAEPPTVCLARAHREGPDGLSLDRDQGPFEQTAVVLHALTGSGTSCADAPAHRPSCGRDGHSRHCLCNVDYVPPRRVEFVIIEGDGGSGKSRAVKRLVVEFAVRQLLIVVAAWTNKAAVAFGPRAMTVHALFGLGIEGDDDGNFVVALQSEGGTVTPERMEWLRQVGAIVVDEIFGLTRDVVEAIVAFCRAHDLRVRLVGNGDSQQIPPVADGPGETRDASLVSSPEYRMATARFVLTVQYRQSRDARWAAQAQRTGMGEVARLHNHPFNCEAEHATAFVAEGFAHTYIMPPQGGATAEHAAERLDELMRGAIEWLWPRNPRTGLLDMGAGGGKRTILCGTNKQVARWNAKIGAMQEEVTGVAPTIYHASNAASLQHGDGVGEDLAAASLNDEASLFDAADPTAPLSETRLRVGDQCLLLLTVDRVAGLVKNATVVVAEMRWHAVVVETQDPNGAPVRHTLCRQTFTIRLGGHSTGVVIKRKQVPLKLAGAITINKAQGQTLDRAIIDGTRPFWQHGMCNVALGRLRTGASAAVFVDYESSTVGPGGGRVPVLRNVAYPFLLDVRR